MKGKPKTVVENCTVNRDRLSGQLVHCHVRLRDHKVVPCGQEVLFLKARPFLGEDNFGVREVTAGTALWVRANRSSRELCSLRHDLKDWPRWRAAFLFKY